MKIFPHVKKNLIAFLRDGKVTVICFLIFPMIMAYIYGTMQEDVFNGKASFEPIKVEFSYNESSKEGKLLSSILKEEQVKNFIIIENKEPDCKIYISEDFKSIKIENIKASDNQTNIVKGFMETFNESINQYTLVINNVEKLILTPQEKGELINKLMNKLTEVNKEPLIEDKILEGYKTLGAREYYTISIFSFTSIILITILIKDFYKDKKDGILRRSFSTPNKKESYIVGYLTSVFIMTFLINSLYIIINKLLGIAFKDNIINIAVILLFQSLLQTSVIGIIISFIKNEKIVNIIMAAIIALPIVIGGVFFNSDIVELRILQILSDFSPNSLILNSYKNLSITQGLYGAQNQMIMIIALSLIFLTASIIKVKTNLEE